MKMKISILILAMALLIGASSASSGDYTIVDTGQDVYYGDTVEITSPLSGEAYYGQDAQYDGLQPSYSLSGDGLTVSDNNTGLTWQRSADTDEDEDIDVADKLTWSELQTYPDILNADSFGGYNDWRLPSIKELYSLMDFRGIDPSGYEDTDTSGLIPFIDNDYFDFAYGDTDAGERIIDAQYGSSTLYVSTTGGEDQTLFGVNFADGRIKGYGLTLFGSDKTFFAICCRGNTSYGINNFVDNGDGTITDSATGLIWQEEDSGTGYDWEDALDYAENLDLADYDDWRLPNAKELQSILDYTRSPDTTGSAAIDPVFSCTAINDEAGAVDYPFYWTGTTHTNWTGAPGKWAAYICFGEALGYMNESWVDVHGAGAQRSDPKYDDGTDYSTGNGPQGDAVRIYNYVRCVRSGGNAAPTPTPAPPVLESGDYDGDGTDDISVFRASSGLWSIRNVSRAYFGGSGDIPVSGDYDGDGKTDIALYRGSSGLWAVRDISRIYFGSSSDIPVPGDYDGNGSCDVGVFRESSGLWAIKGVSRLYFGTSNDRPVPGNYAGDDTTIPAIFRESSGLWAMQDVSRVYFGADGDEAVPGDYDGDGIWEAGIFRASAGLWAVRGVTRSYFGGSSDNPVPADYDGDGTDDIGIFRSNSGLWALCEVSRVYYGSSGDTPVVR